MKAIKLNGPVLPHCKSRNRSLRLRTLGEVLDRRFQSPEIMPFGKQFGIDLKIADEWAGQNINTGDEKP